MNFFFPQAPALFYALALLLGIEAAINPSLWLLVPFSLLFSLVWRSKMRVILGFSLLFLGFLLMQATQSRDSLPDGIKGEAYFKPESIKLNKSRFGKVWCYYGKLAAFNPSAIKNVPATLKLRETKSLRRPSADHAYLIPAALYSYDGSRYLIKPEKEIGWKKIKRGFQLIEWRFHAKEKVKGFIAKQFKSRKSGSFLAGLVTGEFEQQEIRESFSRFGLLHLLAISGFHFSLLASMLNRLLRPLFSPYLAALISLIALTLYFIFLGSSASILRAWLTIVSLLSAELMKKNSTSLNSFGIALMLSLLYDPQVCTNIGFQFSFLITAGILLLHQPLESFLEYIFPRRTQEELNLLSTTSKVQLVILGYFRSAAALNLATTLTAIPLTLFIFEKFPLLSLFYNLFFPFLVSISLFLFLFGSLLFFIPFPFFIINNAYTSFILKMTENVPSALDLNLSCKDFPYYLAIVSYSLLFYLAAHFKKRSQELIFAN